MRQRICGAAPAENSAAPRRGHHRSGSARLISVWRRTRPGRHRPHPGEPGSRSLPIVVRDERIHRSEIRGGRRRQASKDGAGGDRAEFLNQKIVTATFFIEQLVPAQLGLMPSIMSGNDILANFHPAV